MTNTHHDALRAYQRSAEALAEIEHAAERGWCDPEEATAARIEHKRAWSNFIAGKEETKKLSDLRAARDAANADLERVSGDPTATESEIRKPRKIASAAHNACLMRRPMRLRELFMCNPPSEAANDNVPCVALHPAALWLKDLEAQGVETFRVPRQSKRRRQNDDRPDRRT